jgi:rhamnosyltransferase
MIVSVVIRTLDEQRHLGELLSAVCRQIRDDFEIEIVIIDSGSTDKTLIIAESFDCNITHITKSEFTFGRSLNMGSKFSKGEILVYVSGHCVPSSDTWLKQLIKPIREGIAGYSYGRQIGYETTKYSERRLFEKYFPDQSKIPQKDFFCNNANAAISRQIWTEHQFDEQVTGLEDMELAKRYCKLGGKVAYVSEAVIHHIHDEKWSQTRRRYEREAIALQLIMPEVHVGLADTIRYLLASIFGDFSSAIKEHCFFRECFGIVKFRLAQYLGTYRGNHEHRALSKRRKENYFYPTKTLQD